MKAPGAAAAPGPEGSGTSVLVIEEDASIAAQLVRGLTRGGYEVAHVMTGNEMAAGAPHCYDSPLRRTRSASMDTCRPCPNAAVRSCGRLAFKRRGIHAMNGQ
jgi:hypothetical protein